MNDWQVSVETKCCCRWRAPQGVGLLKSLRREFTFSAKCRFPSAGLYDTFCAAPSLQTHMDKCLSPNEAVPTLIYTIRVKIPISLSLRLFTQRCDLQDGADAAFLTPNYFKIPWCFSTLCLQNEILWYAFWSLAKSSFPDVCEAKKRTYGLFEFGMWWSYLLYQHFSPSVCFS